MANRNRTAGNSLETTIVQTINRRTILDKWGIDINISNKKLRNLDPSVFNILPKLGSTRELSRSLDARKVDITTVIPEKVRDFPYLIQTKTLAGGKADYPLFLGEIREKNSSGIPVFIHQQTTRTVTKTDKVVFKVRDEFACLYLTDFIDMMFRIAELEFELKQREFHEKI